MHRSYGLQGSLKRRYKHPSPTSINGYHAAKKLLSQWPAKRPTFAFAGESGYTLAFANRIARSGSHGETRGVSDGGGITTLGAFRTFTNIPGSGIRTAYFAAFGSWSGGALEERRKPSGQRCAYACRCPEGVAAPLGCVIFSVSVEIAACMPCAQGLSVCARHGRYHYPRRALRAAETLDGRLSKRLTRRFLALPDSSLIPAAQNIVPFLYRCQKDQRDTRWSFHFCSHLLTCPDRPGTGR